MTFTAADILRIAECVEKRVAEFYRSAAVLYSPLPQRRLCLELAEQNQRFSQYWSRTRAGLHLANPDLSAPNDDREAAFQPESMVALTWLGEGWRSPGKLRGHEDETQILRDAQRRIADLTTFYEGLKGFALDKDGIAMIDRIVQMGKRQRTGIEQRLQIQTLHHPTLGSHSRVPAASFLN